MLGREEASASAVGISVAAATIAVAFVAAELMVAQPAGRDARDVTYAATATTGLDLLVGSAGRATNGGEWTKDADRMARFGLAVEGKPNFLDYAKVRALRNGTMALLPNGHPDYPESRAALGITEGDFHLRSYPVLPGLDDPRWTKEPHGRLAYFARYSGATAPVEVTTSVVLSAWSLNVTVELRNAATAPAIYEATVGVGNRASGNVVVSEDRHTRLLQPGETDLVRVEFPPLRWDASVDAVKVDVRDPYGNAALGEDGQPVGPVWISQRPPTTNPLDFGFLVHSADFYVVAGAPVVFHADHYEGDGGKTRERLGQFVLVGPNGREWFNTTLPGQEEKLPKNRNAVYEHTCSNCTAPGVYTAILWDTQWKRAHVDRVWVSPSRLFTEKATMDPLAVKEISLLSELVRGFNPTRHDPVTNPQGDVFGDDSNGPSALVDLLPRYTTLVVGSDVSQTALTPSAVKYGIADWVQKGGNLLVLGTVNRESRWLEPVYKAAQTTANGGISAPDPTHPILSAPNRLSHDRYLDRARAWDIDNDAPFTHVLTRGSPNGDSSEDTLAVSHPGALNNGTVVLTSYMPGSLTSPQDDMEAKRLLHNLLSQSHNMLFIDYGPPIPPGVPVGSDTRLVAVEHPNVPGAVVEVRLVMYVFG